MEEKLLIWTAYMKKKKKFPYLCRHNFILFITEVIDFQISKQLRPMSFDIIFHLPFGYNFLVGQMWHA